MNEVLMNCVGSSVSEEKQKAYVYKIFFVILKMIFSLISTSFLASYCIISIDNIYTYSLHMNDELIKFKNCNDYHNYRCFLYTHVIAVSSAIVIEVDGMRRTTKFIYQTRFNEIFFLFLIIITRHFNELFFYHDAEQQKMKEIQRRLFIARVVNGWW